LFDSLIVLFEFTSYTLRAHEFQYLKSIKYFSLKIIYVFEEFLFIYFLTSHSFIEIIIKFLMF
jgi:hypothetical protein